jgi:Zn-dependent alcohol dehydrogenase
MKTRAAVAWEAGKPLEIEMLELDGPKAGEVLLRNVTPRAYSHRYSVTRAARLSRKLAKA